MQWYEHVLRRTKDPLERALDFEVVERRGQGDRRPHVEGKRRHFNNALQSDACGSQSWINIVADVTAATGPALG